MRRGVSGKGGRASWWWGLTRVGAGCVLVGMGCVQINGEDGDGWAYGCSGVAASQGVAERHQILRCRFLFRGLFFLGLPLSNPILRLARTALCRRRTSRVQILASAMRRCMPLAYNPHEVCSKLSREQPPAALARRCMKVEAPVPQRALCRCPRPQHAAH